MVTTNPAQPEENKGLFKSDHHENPQALSDLSSQVNNVARRLRLMEERYTSTRASVQVNEKNMLDGFKKTHSELRSFHDDIKGFKREINELKDTVKLIVSELKLLAKKEEVKVLERYINIWEPVNFVTQNEVERIVKRELEKKLNPSDNSDEEY